MNPKVARLLPARNASRSDAQAGEDGLFFASNRVRPPAHLPAMLRIALQAGRYAKRCGQGERGPPLEECYNYHC
ncbi:MAG: hypothetical protein A2X46_03910 [Lentisphaerae bacterium GWF2_57_35]|nr:MAG: hypothetical protein A2X46_03910 [Lentisphaerae bacterium GWF2_57_35]